MNKTILKYRQTLAAVLLSLLAGAATAQPPADAVPGPAVSFRGLSLPSDGVIWVSGNKGTVGRSVDTGRHWTWPSPAGFGDRDFRDIEAFDSLRAIVIAVDTPALILRTADGGVSWQTVYRNDRPGMFLDGMDFSDDRHGLVVGDPMDGRFFLAATDDGGLTWREMTGPDALPGEACFAASGTGIIARSGGFALVSGGAAARFITDQGAVRLPLGQGEASQGAFSMAARDGKKRRERVVVGGDYAKPKADSANCAISKDGGLTWKKARVPPGGYRSCVAFLADGKLVACGTTGVDVSNDGGFTWVNISPRGYNVCRRPPVGNLVWFAGDGGRITSLTLMEVDVH